MAFLYASYTGVVGGIFQYNATPSNWSTSPTTHVASTRIPNTGDIPVFGDLLGAGCTGVNRTAATSVQGVLDNRTLGPLSYSGGGTITIGTGGISVSPGTTWALPVIFNNACTATFANSNTTTINGASANVTFNGCDCGPVVLTQGTATMGAGGLICTRFSPSGAAAKTLAGSGPLTVATALGGTVLDTTGITVTATGPITVRAAATCTVAGPSSGQALTLTNPVGTTLTVSGSYGAIDLSGVLGTLNNNGISTTGSFALNPSIAGISGSGTLTLAGGSGVTQDVDLQGLSCAWPITQTGAGTVRLLRDIVTSGAWIARILKINGKTLQAASLRADVIGGITAEGGSITLTGSGSVLTGSVVNAFADAVTVRLTSASAKTVASYGSANLTLVQAGAGALTVQGLFTGSNNEGVFADIQASVTGTTVIFQSFGVFTLGALSLSNTTLRASTAGTQATLSKASGTVTLSGCSITDLAATGGATWRAPVSSGNTDGGGNTGWDFGAVATSMVAASATQARTTGSPTLATKSALVLADAAQAQAAGSPTLAAKSAVAPDNAAQGQSASLPAIAARSVLAPDPAAQAQAATAPSIATNNSVVPASAEQAQAATSPSLSTRNTLVPADAAQVHAAGSPVIAARSGLTPDPALQGQVVTAPALFAGSAIEPANAVQGQVAGSPGLSAASVIAPADAAQLQVASSPAVASVVPVNPFRFPVEPEARRLAVAAEDRMLDVQAEVRVRIVPGETRTFVVDTQDRRLTLDSPRRFVVEPESRRLAVPQDVRVVRFPGDRRTLAVAAEDRTFIVEPQDRKLAS